MCRRVAPVFSKLSTGTSTAATTSWQADTLMGGCKVLSETNLKNESQRVRRIIARTACFTHGLTRQGKANADWNGRGRGPWLPGGPYPD